MTTYEVLEKTLDLIRDPSDWHGGSEPAGPGGSLCVGSALLRVTGREWWNHHELDADVALAGALGDGNPVSCPMGWIALKNEQCSHEEIVTALQDAIRAEKARAGVELRELAPIS
jgi:hypothetical protein